MVSRLPVVWRAEPAASGRPTASSRPRYGRLLLGLLAYLLFAFNVVAFTLHRESNDSLEDHALRAQYEGQLALNGLEFARAERHYRLAADLIRANGANRDDNSQAWYGEALEGWGDALKAQGRYRPAVRSYTRALQMYEKAYGRYGEALIGPLYELRQIHEEMGRDSLAVYCEARIDTIALYHARVLQRGVDSMRVAERKSEPLFAEMLMDLGDLYVAQGATEMAEVAFLEAYETRARVYGPNYLETAHAQSRVGMVASYAGKSFLAKTTLDSSLTVQEDSFGKDDPHLAEELRALADVAMDEGRFADADSLYCRTLAGLERVIGRDQNYALETMKNVAECRAELRRFAEARVMMGRVVAIHSRLHGAVSFPVGIDLLEMAELEWRAGNVVAARERCRKALAVLERAVGWKHSAALEARFYWNELQRTPEGPEGDGDLGGGRAG
jgi:tetratricopeptide (TPR) repeat protein